MLVCWKSVQPLVFFPSQWSRQLFDYHHSLKYIILCSAETDVNEDRILIFGELSH